MRASHQTRGKIVPRRTPKICCVDLLCISYHELVILLFSSAVACSRLITANMFRGLLSLQPAYLAALALICIQVGIGIVYKIAQTNGRYEFSASSSTAITEFFKFLLSLALFYNERLRKDVEEKIEGPPTFGLRHVAQAYFEELPTESRYGFALLALFYAAINNTVSAQCSSDTIVAL